MDLMKADEIYRAKVKENPQFDHDLIMTFREEMPEEFSDVMYVCAYGKHIFDGDWYEKAVSYLENKDGSSGAHWSVETLDNKAGYRDNEHYTKYDYYYIVNMLFSDFGNVFTEPSYYFRMAHNYLTDEDYYGEAGERAFCDAKCRMKYFKDAE